MDEEAEAPVPEPVEIEYNQPVTSRAHNYI